MSDLIAVAVVDLKAGPALDWAVAKAAGQEVEITYLGSKTDLSGYSGLFCWLAKSRCPYKPSTDWAQGGPLIEQFDIWIAGPLEMGRPTQACSVGIDGVSTEGNTKLEAACKAIVAAKFGDAVTVPRELVEVQS